MSMFSFLGSWRKRPSNAALCANANPVPSAVCVTADNLPTVDQTVILRRDDLRVIRERLARQEGAIDVGRAVELERELEAKKAALATMHKAWDGQVIELATVRAALDEAARAPSDAPVTPAAPKAKPVRKAAAPKVVKPVKLKALEFWALHGQAVSAISAVYGDQWQVTAPFGETALATLAVGYRSAKTERKTVLRWSKDQRIPAARYWPNGCLPDGVTVTPDYPRADPRYIAYNRMRGHVMDVIRERHAHTGLKSWDKADQRARRELADLRAMPKPDPAERRDAAWHKAHGYAWTGSIWVAEILFRSQRDHQDFILEEREFKRFQALELASLTYGPQPMPEMDLAEAAD